MRHRKSPEALRWGQSWKAGDAGVRLWVVTWKLGERLCSRMLTTSVRLAPKVLIMRALSGAGVLSYHHNCAVSSLGQSAAVISAGCDIIVLSTALQIVQLAPQPSFASLPSPK